MIQSRAIVTGIFGADYWRIADVSLPTIRNYANRIGADLIVLEERFFPEWHPYWEKLALGRLLTGYDSVAWIDLDAIVNPDAPDIFKEFHQQGFSAFDEGRLFVDRPEQLLRDAKFYNLENVVTRPRPFAYFNVGVMVASRAVRSLFTPPRRVKTDSIMPEQTFLNLRLIETGFPFHDLTSKWNGLHSIYKAGQRGDLHVVHYAGWPRIGDWVGAMTGQMREDLAVWRAA